MPTVNLQRLFTTKRSRNSAARIPRYSTDVLNPIIAELTQDISDLQDKLISQHQNIQTIRRCIQQLLPADRPRSRTGSSSPHSPHSDEESGHSPEPCDRVESYATSTFPLLKFDFVSAEGNDYSLYDLEKALLKLSEVPAPTRLKPLNKKHTITIPPPRFKTTNSKGSESDGEKPKSPGIPMTSSIPPRKVEALLARNDAIKDPTGQVLWGTDGYMSWEEIKLCLLVLKKVECEVEVDISEGNIAFWGRIWEDIKQVIPAQEDELGTFRKSLFNGGTPFNSKDFGSGRSSIITRKQVPVSEILRRGREEMGDRSSPFEAQWFSARSLKSEAATSTRPSTSDLDEDFLPEDIKVERQDSGLGMTSGASYEDEGSRGRSLWPGKGKAKLERRFSWEEGSDMLGVFCRSAFMNEEEWERIQDSQRSSS